MNIFFADNNEKYQSSFISSFPSFGVYEENEDTRVDILVLDGTSLLERFRTRKIDTCICPSSRYYDVISTMHVRSAVSCGMREKDSVTFSSIGETDAMVCLKRNINFLDCNIEPCEFKTIFDRKRGLYANLALGALEFFVKNYGETRNVFKKDN